jgi:LCP family protein required for cell wall assembly
MRIGRRRRDAAAADGVRPPRGRRSRRSVALVAAAWISGIVVVTLVAGALVGYAKYRQIWDGIHHDQLAGLGKRPPKYTNALNLLIFGSDSRDGLSPHEQARLHVGHEGCGCSDTIMVVHVSPGRHKVTVLNLPRDTMVPVYGCLATGKLPGQQNDPAAMVQINQTLSHGGPSCLYKTVEHTTGIHLDHFIQVEFAGVVKVVNDIGGVNVCVPASIHDPNSGLNITAGRHHIDGLTFLEFWRARYTLADGTDLKRISRDDLLLAQMLRGILGSGLLSSPTRLLPVVDDAVRAIYATDAGFTQSEMLKLAESFRGLTSKDVQFIEASTEPYPPAPAQVQLVQPTDGQLFSAIEHDKKLPKKAKHPRPGRTAIAVTTIAPARVSVQVLNGSGVANVAANTAATLTARGFHVVGTGDATTSDYTQSVIEYASAADLAAARTLAGQISGVKLRRVPGLTAGTVTLILGSSFTSVGASPSASPSSSPGVGSLAKNFGGITGSATCKTDSSAFQP